MKKAINITITALLVAAMLIPIRIIFWDNAPLSVIIVQAIVAVLCVLVLYYNFWGYKKPHGNLLRYTFLIYGSTMIINPFFLGDTKLPTLCLIVSGIITIYMSGRLNKIEKNKVLTIIVLALQAVFAALNIFSIDISPVAAQSTSFQKPEVSAISILGVCTCLFQFLALSLAYTSRYAAHKEAGLEDKQKA